MSEQHAANSEWVINTTDATFERDVVERSREVPVVVDFWADWCQPCRLLTPVLEEAAREHAGTFVLAKANTDDCPQAAAGMQVQAIPTVFAFSGGEPIDFFQGLLNRQQFEVWLQRVARRGQLTRAAGLESSQPEAAESLYREILAEAPNEVDASIGLMRVVLDQGRVDEVRELLATLEKRGFLEPEAEKIKARLELGDMASDDLASLRSAAESKPDDLGTQLQLAEALAAAGQHEEALQRCLELVERDRHGVGETARQVMVDIFRVLPEESPLTGDYRRKLALALY